ncbi:MAG: hypothetical protein ACFFFO_09715 [Candidatus Thorarchaeota archaeon]
MKVDSEVVKKGILVIGVFITTIGLALHLSIPGTTRSGFPVNVSPTEMTIENIQVSNSIGYEFGIELIGPEQIQGFDTSAYLLDSFQYADYLSGTLLNETDVLISLVGGGRGFFEMTLTEDLNLYLIVTSNHNETIPWSYYYYILPATFYPTFTMAFAGAFFTITGLAWFYSGWKRWALTALGIQSIFFFVRVFTLSTYSLNLPDIFWDFIHTELYNDYQYFYLSWIPRLWEGAWAYSADLAVYLYPPLWIYTVGLLGSTPSWFPGLILFTFNAATGVVIYRIMMELTGNDMQSRIAMILYMLNPFTIFYGAFMWLNPTPYVFFVTLSFYLALKEKAAYSIATLALATLYKQFAVIFFPIIVILLVKQKVDIPLKSKFFLFLKQTVIYTSIVGLVSLPFLIVSPNEFLNQMLLWNTGAYNRLVVFIPESWMTVHANTFFLWLGFPSWFIEPVAFLLSNYVFLILCGFLIYGGFSFWKPRFEKGKEKVRNQSAFMKAILWSFVAVMSVQLFYPRGAYKFYLLALTPFMALLFDYKDLELSSKKQFTFQNHHILPILLSWAIFLCYRFVYFWLLGAWVLFYLYRSGDLSRISTGIVGQFKRNERQPAELEDIYTE